MLCDGILWNFCFEYYGSKNVNYIELLLGKDDGCHGKIIFIATIVKHVVCNEISTNLLKSD
jgi:hypothetical protein